MKWGKFAGMTLLAILAVSANVQAREMPQTLFEIAGVKQPPARLSDSVLVIIDAQREYVDGKLPLDGIAPSIREAATLLQRAREAGTPVIHVVHRGGGMLFNPETPYFAIVPELRPLAGEKVVEKTLPNAFAGTHLATLIAQTGKKNLILIGFMTHNCVSSTARAALDLGYRDTIVASATASRDLPDGKGGIVSAATIQAASLAGLADRMAVVVATAGDIAE